MAGAPLKCEAGPVKKTYGGGAWLAYGCDDRRSVALVADRDNPAFPFYFIFIAKPEGYQLEGEGTGSKQATAATYEELKTLSRADIAALAREIRPD